MAVSVYKGYELQATGSNSGTWGGTLNDDVINRIDANMGGIVTKTLSSTDVSLSATESRAAILSLSGALTANVQVTTSAQGFLYVENKTTGSYTVTITNGVGAVVIPPQGTVRQVIIDATNGVRSVGLLPPGTMVDYGGAASTWPVWMEGEYLLAYGQAVSRTTYAALFAAIGTTHGTGNGTTTFNLPDTRGRATFGRDDMGGSAASRVTSGGSGVDGATLGAVGGAQTHTLTEAQMPAHDHTASSESIASPVFKKAITRTMNTIGGGSYDVVLTHDSASDIGGAYSPSAVSGHSHTIGDAGSGSAHNNMPPAMMVNKMIKI